MNCVELLALAAFLAAIPTEVSALEGTGGSVREVELSSLIPTLKMATSVRELAERQRGPVAFLLDERLKDGSIVVAAGSQNADVFSRALTLKINPTTNEVFVLRVDENLEEKWVSDYVPDPVLK